MAYYSEEELRALGLAHVGRNVKISRLAALNNPDRLSIGDHSRIDDFVVVSGKVTIGRNVHVAVFCNLAGGVEGISMDDFSGLAYGCHVFSESDDYSGRTMTNPTVPAKYKQGARKAVFIGRHVIIGTGSQVFPGVIVAEGCSVGAMTMLTKSTEPWGIYFGAPAKRIKERKRDLLEQEAKYLDDENAAY